MDTNEEMEVARNLGIERALDVHAASRTAAARRPATVMQAAMAVATGVAEVVVCYRAFNERSGNRFGNIERADDGACRCGCRGTRRTG